MSRSPRLALVAAAAFAAGAMLVWAAAFRNPAAAELDATVLAGFMGLSGGRVGALATTLAHLADPTPFAFASAALVCLALARRRPWLAGMTVVVLVGANVTTQVLKLLTADPRAVDAAPGLHVALESWPSGHATAAMTLALCMVAVAPARLRPLAAALGGTFALAVVYSILVLGWHFPSDVLGGFCVAAAWTLSGFAAVSAVEAGRREHAPRLGTTVAPAALAALSVGAVVGAAVLTRPDAALAYAQANTMFVAAAAAIGSGALALASALAIALRQ